MRQGADRAPFSERGHDLYETPACAVHALIRNERLPHYIWEPSAGRGAISRVLIKAGHEVFSSDLIDYPGADQDIVYGMDFLLQKAPFGEAIVTNPPFMIADRFIRHGLSLGLPVIVLLRLMALEGSKRSDIVDRHLVRVWAGIERLPKFQREGWSGPRQTSETSPFAWFVFSPKPRGDKPIELRRMSWRAS